MLNQIHCNLWENGWDGLVEGGLDVEQVEKVRLGVQVRLGEEGRLDVVLVVQVHHVEKLHALAVGRLDTSLQTARALGEIHLWDGHEGRLDMEGRLGRSGASQWRSSALGVATLAT
jgi:hypothetical protein